MWAVSRKTDLHFPRSVMRCRVCLTSGRKTRPFRLDLNFRPRLKRLNPTHMGYNVLIRLRWISLTPRILRTAEHSCERTHVKSMRMSLGIQFRGILARFTKPPFSEPASRQRRFCLGFQDYVGVSASHCTVHAPKIGAGCTNELRQLTFQQNT